MKATWKRSVFAKFIATPHLEPGSNRRASESTQQKMAHAHTDWLGLLDLPISQCGLRRLTRFSYVPEALASAFAARIEVAKIPRFASCMPGLPGLVVLGDKWLEGRNGVSEERFLNAIPSPQGDKQLLPSLPRYRWPIS